MIIDMHCHLYEFSDDEIFRILEQDKELIIVAVSDDLNSLIRTLELWEAFPERVIPCAGFHPWNIEKRSINEVDDIIRIAERMDLTCLGEVGLDRKFVPQTIDIQHKIFEKFLKASKDLDAFLNIHAPDAWRETLELLIENDIERAMFHWYTGPLDLIDIIGERGYKISINPAVLIQKKHRRVAEVTPLEYMVFESDGPYEYRGLRLTPLLIKRAVEEVSKIKGVKVDDVIRKAHYNSMRLLKILN